MFRRKIIELNEWMKMNASLTIKRIMQHHDKINTIWNIRDEEKPKIIVFS
jgi:hypothetical protein